MTPAEITQVHHWLGDLTRILWGLIQSYGISPNQAELSFISLWEEAERLIIHLPAEGKGFNLQDS